MEPTISEASVTTTLDVSAARKMTNDWSSPSFYKIPLLSLIFFASLSLSALKPDKFHFGFKSQKVYRFNHESLGYYIGDVSFFAGNSYETAEAKIIELFPSRTQKKVKKIIRPLLVLCQKYQLDPFWVLSVMWTESHFKAEAVSPMGAQGLLQIMPSTFSWVLEQFQYQGISFEAEKSEDLLRYQYGQVFYDLGHKDLVAKLRHLEVGIFYLKQMLVAFNGNHHHATVAYNMGPHWTKMRLKNNLPVGVRNQYLTKVLQKYYLITKNLSQTTNVTFIPRN